MTAERKLAWRAVWPLASVLVAGALCVHCVGRRTGSPAKAAAPLDDWDVPRLVDYLNAKGLGLRVVSTLKGGGGTDRLAFLTTTGQGWEDLSRLPRGRPQVERWRGTLYCERGPSGGDWADLTREWGDCCLVVGPFLLYGDRELLGRVGAALSDFTQPGGRPSRASTAGCHGNETVTGAESEPRLSGSHLPAPQLAAGRSQRPLAWWPRRS